jgi:acyl-coenzyme A synthetase/AMP-(fatty) acid ligase/outer membrane protein assembly factor BamB
MRVVFESIKCHGKEEVFEGMRYEELIARVDQMPPPPAFSSFSSSSVPSPSLQRLSTVFCSSLREAIIAMAWCAKHELPFTFCSDESIAAFSETEQLTSAIAYVCQSSGSTGVPKRIAVPVDVALPNLIQWKRMFRVGDGVLVVTQPTFDPFIADVFGALMAGATLLLPPNGPSNIKSLYEFCSGLARPITVLHCTPAFMLRIMPIELRARMFCSKHLRRVAFGGEVPVHVASLFGELFDLRKELSPEFEYWSFYGCTELSVWSSMKKLYPRDSSSCCDSIQCIGKPIDETRIWLDQEERICMSRGSVTFCSSDKGMAHGTSCFWFVGRTDRVVKRFGKAISLDEIESSVSTNVYGVVRAYAALYDEITLVLFAKMQVSNAAGPMLTRKTIKQRIRDCFLGKDVSPSDVLVLDEEWPTNQHGKVDTRRLEDIWRKRQEMYTGTIDSERRLREWLERELKRLNRNGDDSDSSFVLSSKRTLMEEGASSIDAQLLAQKLGLRISVDVENILPIVLLHPICEFLSLLIPLLRRVSAVSVTSATLSNEDGVVWRCKTGKCVDSSGAVSQDGCLVAFGCHDGFVYILRVSTGELVAKVDMGGDRIEASCQFAKHGECIVAGTRNGHVRAVDWKSSLVCWSWDVVGSVKGIAVVLDKNNDDDDCVFVTTDAGLYRNGVCCVDGVGFLNAPVATACCASVVVVSSQGELMRFRANDGSVEWRQQLSSKRPARTAFFASPVIIGSLPFVVACSLERVFVCRLDSGSVISDVASDFRIYRSPTVLSSSSSSFLVLGQTGFMLLELQKSDECVAVKANAPLFHTPTTSACCVGTDGVLFGTENGSIIMLHPNDPSNPVVVAQLGASIFSDPLAIGNFIVFGSRDNSIRGVRINTNH